MDGKEKVEFRNIVEKLNDKRSEISSQQIGIHFLIEEECLVPSKRRSSSFPTRFKRITSKMASITNYSRSVLRNRSQYLGRHWVVPEIEEIILQSLK